MIRPFYLLIREQQVKDVTPIGASRSAQLGSNAAAVIGSIPNDDIAVEGCRVRLMKSLRT